MVLPFETAAFLVAVTDENGCADTDAITIFVAKNRNVFIPSVLSPNGDGFNDLIWAAGAGGAPRIATFNGALLDNGSNLHAFRMTRDFFAVGDPSLPDGAHLARGDITGDGIRGPDFAGRRGAPFAPRRSAGAPRRPSPARPSPVRSTGC